jgi:hypothetical protein
MLSFIFERIIFFLKRQKEDLLKSEFAQEMQKHFTSMFERIN